MKIIPPELSKKYLEYLNEHPEEECMYISEAVRIAAREQVRKEFLLEKNRQESTSKKPKQDSHD
jgi:hypothetical protein